MYLCYSLSLLNFVVKFQTIAKILPSYCMGILIWATLYYTLSFFYYARPYAGALSDAFVWRLSVAYIGPKSRTERPRKTKIGTEVAHVTRTPLSRSKVKVTRPDRFTQRGLNA